LLKLLNECADFDLLREKFAGLDPLVEFVGRSVQQPPLRMRRRSPRSEKIGSYASLRHANVSGAEAHFSAL
jgi:hypothetical protein